MVLAAYMEWGRNCPAKFNGMFALVIYDTKTKDLFLARDRFGIKPFYYYENGEKFIFASEERAILPFLRNRKANDRAIFEFADAVIQDSRIAQQAGIALGASVQQNEVIEIGVDFDIFNRSIEKAVARNRLAVGETQPLVFCSRGFAPLYNIDIILRSIAIVRVTFPTVKYVLSNATGLLGQSLLALIEEEQLHPNLILTGKLDHDTEIKYYYRDANVVLSVPSSDSSPASVYEAMACGTPVIISELPWYKGKFTSAKEVVTVPPRDINALAAAIINVLSGNEVLDCDAAYEVVYSKINMYHENKRLERLYLGLLSPAA